MKNLILSLLFCAVYQTGISQNTIPTLATNTELHYSCKLHGQTRALKLTAKVTNDTLVLNLETRGVKSSIVIAQKALKKGNALSFNQGEYADVLYLKPTETFFMISRSAYQDLITNGKFIYNNTTYVLDEKNAGKNAQIDGKPVDTMHVTAQIDQTEMWIIKNTEFPLIYQMTKNPLGINFTLVKIIPN